jgi:hypothetical protein
MMVRVRVALWAAALITAAFGVVPAVAAATELPGISSEFTGRSTVGLASSGLGGSSDVAIARGGQTVFTCDYSFGHATGDRACKKDTQRFGDAATRRIGKVTDGGCFGPTNRFRWKCAANGDGPAIARGGFKFSGKMVLRIIDF